jgi:glycosyltransferase involved in cell wall biosynthesis
MLRPPAILQLLPALDSGGVERGTLEIARRSWQRAFRAVVASRGGRLAGSWRRWAPPISRCHWTRRSPPALWRNAGMLAAVAQEHGVALIHARSRGPAWSGCWPRAGSACPSSPPIMAPIPKGWPGKRLYNSVMARGDRVIAISRFIAGLVEARHGTDPARIRVIPRGVDPRRFDPWLVAPERVAAQRMAWQVPDAAPVLLLPARLSRWKGQATLIAALAALPDAVAVLAGDTAGRGGYVAQLTAEAGRLGLLARLRFAGHVTTCRPRCWRPKSSSMPAPRPRPSAAA